MKTRLILATLTVCALTVVPSASRAADTSCGGFAPAVRSCSFTGVLALENDLFIEMGPLYTGAVDVTIATATGQHSFGCDFVLSVRIGSCTFSDSGVIIPDQLYTLTARVGLPLAGISQPAVAVGRWNVALRPAA
jgi:hypothetical protein